jgi:tRNA threonylcarbamoyladenosine biosynthesis protein TsaE
MGGSIDLLTRAPEETRKAAAALAELLGPGDVVSLTGELGAGKTAFVQGAAKALGVDTPVVSPTFVLVREYRGEMPIYHIDVYRLERLQEVHDLGFEDFLGPAGLVFVEWGDAIEALLPDSHLRVELRTEDEETRRIRVSARGPAWAPRWERLEGILEPWRVTTEGDG